MPDTPVKLSLCIPTHHGRGWCLREALDSIIADAEASGIAPAEFEVCVSDNSSQDETRAVIAAAQQRTRGLISYFRFPLNVGIYSWFNVVEMARGEYVWLFGSDDVLQPGAVRAVLDRLAAYPSCAGITASYEHYDFHLQRRLPMHPRAYYAEDYDRERLIAGFDNCLTQFTLPQGFMSVQIVRRDLWLRAIKNESPDFVHYAWHYTHVYLLSRVMQLDPAWVWTPLAIVKMRGENGEVPERLGAKAYAVPLAYLRDMTSIWSRVCGRNRALYRRVLAKSMRLTFSPAVVRHLKMHANHTAADDFRLLAAFTRYFWPLPAYWLRTFPALLVPHGIWKRLSRLRGYANLKAWLRSGPKPIRRSAPPSL